MIKALPLLIAIMLGGCCYKCVTVYPSLKGRPIEKRKKEEALYQKYKGYTELDRLHFVLRGKS